MQFIHTPFHHTTQRQRLKSLSGCMSTKDMIQQHAGGFEKKSTMPPSHALAPTSAFCVCQPLFQRVLPSFIFQLCKQGAGVCFRCLQPTKTHLSHGDIVLGRQNYVPACSFTSCYSTFPTFDSWSFMLPPKKQVPTAFFSRLRVTVSRARETLFQHFK